KMSESASNEYRISIDEEISRDEKISYFDVKNPHYGVKIDKVVFSPKMNYFATANFRNRSVCVWEFKQGRINLELKQFHFFDLKETVLYNPICVSDFNKILIGNFYKGYFVLETRDCNNKEGEGEEGEKLLDNREHDGDVVNCGFLTNGDFAVVEGNPTYQVHIFSFIGGKWHSTSKIKLVKFKHAAVSHDSVLILIDLPFVIMQWNLLTLKFEKQYELDWSLAEYRKGILMELSCDQKILAVAGRLNTNQKEDSNTNQEEDSNTKHEEDSNTKYEKYSNSKYEKYLITKHEEDSNTKQEKNSNTKHVEDSNTKQEKNSRVYFYSTKSGRIIGNQSFDEKFYEKKKTIKNAGIKFDKRSISKILFIKFEKEEEGSLRSAPSEFLFVYFGQEKTSYVITPPTSQSSLLKLHSLPNSPSESKNLGEFHLSAEIDFFLRYHNDQSFQDQLNNKHNELEDDLHSFKEENQKEGSCDEIRVGSQREDIKKNIDKFLKIYKSKKFELAEQSSTQDSKLSVTLKGNQYIWTVKETSHNNILAAKITAKRTATEVEIGT
ncbi:1702_t:CDS:2, partial [Acaulospora morrowiae]